MMKKILMLFMAVSLVAGVPVIAADETAVAVEEIKLTQSDNIKIELLTYIGIISSLPTENAVTRGDFARYLVKMNNIPMNESKNEITSFSDVPKTDANISYINMASNLGYMNGNGSGEFMPGEGMSFTDAATALVRALGYTEYAGARGGYPAGYLTIASERGIFNGVNTKKETVDEIEAVRMCYNALTAPVLRMTGVGDRRTYEAVKGVTILSENHKIHDGRGLVTANKYTEIDSSEFVCNDAQIAIDKIVYDCAKNVNIDLLGRNVEFFYKEESALDMPEVVAMAEKAGKNNTIDIKAENLSSVSDYRVSYFDDAEKRYTETLSRNFDVILNGRYYADYTSFDELKIKDGFLQLVDNDGDEVYDIVFVNKCETFAVSGIDPNEFIIYCENGLVEFNPYEKNVYYDIMIMSEDGAMMKADINEIKNGNIISVYRSADECCTKVYASTKRIDDMITSMDEDYIYFSKSGQAEIADSCDTDLVSIGKTVTAYIDIYGRVAKMVEVSDKYGYKYAYLVNTADVSGVNSYIEMQFYAGGEKLEKAKTSIMLDGIKGVSLSKADALFEGGSVKRQVVRYRLDNEGYIDSIDTVNIGSGNSEHDKLKLVADASLMYSSTFNSFGSKYKLGGNTVIVGVPQSEKDDIENYSSSFDFENWRNQAVKIYDTDEKMQPSCVVFDSTTTSKVAAINEYSPSGIIKKISKGVNEDGEIVDRVEMMTGNKVVTYNVYKDMADYQPSDSGNPSLKPGDVMLYALNSDKEISNYSKRFSLSGDSVKSVFNTYFTVTAGRAYSKHDGYFSVLNGNRDIGADITDSVLDLRTLVSANGGTFYYVTIGTDAKGEYFVRNIQTTTLDSMSTAKDNLGEECMVYSRTYQHGRLYECVMYKFTD